MSNVPNLLSPLVDKLGRVLSPWNSFFQKFTANAVAVTGVPNPFVANTQGCLIFTGVTGTVILTRGTYTVDLTGERIIPMAVGDEVSWSGGPAVQFLGTFSK